MDRIQHISPSAFYYWEKCPLQAVLSRQAKTLFSKHPDADLGSLIHKFYEKHVEWNISTVNEFNAKWIAEIEILNEQYKCSSIQFNYYPIQWHSRYYAVKKHLLCNRLLAIKKKRSRKAWKYLYEVKISNDLINGRIDLLVLYHDQVKQLIDFKTGNIYEKVEQGIRLKEVYKQQLAMYCSVILERQDFIPDIFIETINGNRVKIEIEFNYILELIKRVRLLKEKINSAIESNALSKLSNVTIENCKHCYCRINCKEYKEKMMNRSMGTTIDINGRITAVNEKEVIVQTSAGQFVIRRIRQKDKYKLDKECEVYNLYLPNGDSSYLYETTNSLINYEY